MLIGSEMTFDPEVEELIELIGTSFCDFDVTVLGVLERGEAFLVRSGDRSAKDLINEVAQDLTDAVNAVGVDNVYASHHLLSNGVTVLNRFGNEEYFLLTEHDGGFYIFPNMDVKLGEYGVDALLLAYFHDLVT